MKQIVLLIGVLLAFSLATAIAWPQIAAANNGLTRTHFPSDQDPGAPVYARIEPVSPYVYSDGDWAAIVFYRDPYCIPAGFNLLLMIDLPNALGCSLTIEGTQFWEGEPFANIPPFMAKFKGSGAVPVWFVPAGVIGQALQDGVLAIGELAGLEGLLIGSADRFTEMIQPEPLPGESGGNPNPILILNAHGHLEDGRQFNLHITTTGTFDAQSIQIQFH